MTDEKKMKAAQNVYQTICKTLENRNWNFEKREEDLVITCGVRGDDLPVDLLFKVNAEAQVVSLYSILPFKMSEDKRVDGALAVSVANYGLINGSFDYDLTDGEIRFRVATSYRESLLSEELFNYMIVIAASTVDDYNDKLLMVSTGMMTIEQFIEWEKNR